jgi:hypothetical protein
MAKEKTARRDIEKLRSSNGDTVIRGRWHQTNYIDVQQWQPTSIGP